MLVVVTLGDIYLPLFPENSDYNTPYYMDIIWILYR